MASTGNDGSRRSSRPRTRSLSTVPAPVHIKSERENSSSASTWRKSTVYDAVAGRVTTDRFVNINTLPPSSRDLVSKSKLSVPPDEVLFRRRNAPTRYVEDDIYFAASAALDPHDAENALPGSDLVKAVHSYTADYYDRAGEGGGKALTDWKSMDETALLAVGILLEEAVKSSLGDAGDMVFVVGEEDAEEIRRLEEKQEREKEAAKVKLQEDEEGRTSVPVPSKGKGKGKATGKRKRGEALETRTLEKRHKRGNVGSVPPLTGQASGRGEETE